MPLFGSGPGQAPAWGEMTLFDIVDLQPGDTHVYPRAGLHEKIVVGRGQCRISNGDASVEGGMKTKLELRGSPRDRPRNQSSGAQAWLDDRQFTVTDVTEPTTLIRVAGHWDPDDCGTFGVFRVGEGDNRRRAGDPVAYPKTTRFDAHWHDCDEYWIFFEGRAEVVSEGRHYQVGPGDCIATGIGHHHDVAHVHGEYVLGVYHETTLHRQKRRGHLWEHTHSPANPIPDRV